MSLSIKLVVIDRIKTAISESPIAVFRTERKGKEGEDLFEAVFARTVRTAEILKSENDNLIGVFFGESGCREFRGRC